MKNFRCFFLLAVAAWSSSAHAQNGCKKPQDPTGYFEGVAANPQAGKLNISLNLRYDNGQYAGDLATPVGTYSVTEGQFAAGQLHLKLEAGNDTLSIDGNLDAGVLRGKFVSNDETGPIELRRVGDARAAAVAATSSLTKQQWHEDLAFLAQELPKRHANAFNFISRERFEAEVAQLDSKLDGLNADEIYVGMDTIANSIGDGHTYVEFPADTANFPIDIEEFGGEYRVDAVAIGNENALGARVVKINDVPVARVHEMLLSMTPGNETQVLRDARADDFLSTGITLHGMGIIPDRNVAHYTLATDDGQQFTVDVHALTPAEMSDLHWTLPFKDPPLSRQRPGEDLWCTYLTDSRAVYCDFRSYKDLGKNAKALFDLVRQQHPDRLVIDMRYNGGGDYFKGLKHLVHPISKLPDLNRKGHLFVLIGPDTFSAAMSNASHFRYQTNAILVGQQIGEKPNSYQEAREMTLPNSHWKVRYSVKFYKFVESGENVIRPDQEIIPSWNEFKSGQDPVLEWVLKYRAANGVAP